MQATRIDQNMLAQEAISTYLEASGAPVDELDGFPGLDGCNGGLSLLWCDITTVEQATRHVLALAGVALDHLVAGLEARERHLGDGVLLVVRLVGGEERREAGDGEVDTREGHQVRLELVEIDVQATIESERSGDRRDDLGDESVQVGEARRGDVEVLLADLVDGFVVNLQAF